MKISGKIASQPADKSVIQPASLLDVGQVDSGTKKAIFLDFKNTGNVEQTLTMLPFSNPLEVSADGFFTLDGVPTENPLVAVLFPGQSVEFQANLAFTNIPLGSPDTDFSIDLDWIWS